MTSINAAEHESDLHNWHSRRQTGATYSILQSGGNETAAKIVLFEAALAKGSWQPGADGVYICLRTEGHPATANFTVGFKPWQDERFAFFRLEPAQDLNVIAAFIGASADY